MQDDFSDQLRLMVWWAVVILLVIALVRLLV
jgi:hypothetical protein